MGAVVDLRNRISGSGVGIYVGEYFGHCMVGCCLLFCIAVHGGLSSRLVSSVMCERHNASVNACKMDTQ